MDPGLESDGSSISGTRTTVILPIVMMVFENDAFRVQVPNNHILTQNLYYNSYCPKPKYQIIGYLDPLGWVWLAWRVDRKSEKHMPGRSRTASFKLWNCPVRSLAKKHVSSFTEELHSHGEGSIDALRVHP